MNESFNSIDLKNMRWTREPADYLGNNEPVQRVRTVFKNGGAE